jgi:hypothetical protein
MTLNENRYYGLFLYELQNPFVMFPFESVAQTINKALENSGELFADRMGVYGVARKFWDVPTELIHTEIGLLIGTAFVLGQIVISQTVGIFLNLRELANYPHALPTGKHDILKLEAEVNTGSEFSEIQIIDSVANYFKHYHEWPSDWNISNTTGSQRRTIEIVKSIGMATNNDLTENMHCALHHLKIDLPDILPMAEKIMIWREKLACLL